MRIKESTAIAPVPTIIRQLFKEHYKRLRIFANSMHPVMRRLISLNLKST